MYLVIEFFFTFIMCLDFHCFIYVGVTTSTRKYEDIACRSWEYIRTWIYFLKMLMEQIESYRQCEVYNYIQIDVCFKFGKGEMKRTLNTQRAKHR